MEVSPASTSVCIYAFTSTSLGVAVGAGELEEEDAKKLVETLEELEETRAKLLLVQSENREFRRRLNILEGRIEPPEEMSEA